MGPERLQASAMCDRLATGIGARVSKAAGARTMKVVAFELWAGRETEQGAIGVRGEPEKAAETEVRSPEPGEDATTGLLGVRACRANCASKGATCQSRTRPHGPPLQGVF